MDLQLLEHSRARPSLRRCPFFRSPIINVPVRFVHKLEKHEFVKPHPDRETGRGATHLVELRERLGVHRAEMLPRERAEEEVALERAALAALVYEARARCLDGLSGAR